MPDCRIADCAVRTCLVRWIPPSAPALPPHAYSGSAIGYLAGFWALCDGCPPGRGIENAGLQDADCAVRTCFPSEVCNSFSGLRTAYSALPIQAGPLSGILPGLRGAL